MYIDCEIYKIEKLFYSLFKIRHNFIFEKYQTIKSPQLKANKNVVFKENKSMIDQVSSPRYIQLQININNNKIELKIKLKLNKIIK